MTLTRPNPMNIDEVVLVASIFGFEFNHYEDIIGRTHYVLTRPLTRPMFTQRLEFKKFSELRHYLSEQLWKDAVKTLHQ